MERGHVTSIRDVCAASLRAARILRIKPRENPAAETGELLERHNGYAHDALWDPSASAVARRYLRLILNDEAAESTSARSA